MSFFSWLFKPATPREKAGLYELTQKGDAARPFVLFRKGDAVRLTEKEIELLIHSLKHCKNNHPVWINAMYSKEFASLKVLLGW